MQYISILYSYSTFPLYFNFSYIFIRYGDKNHALDAMERYAAELDIIIPEER